ncbi:MAG TPA: class I SAM-dependent methyltransferase [Spirochaetota bacterium]|nr:class I SAM-dependent methyltransferase [Spirochaetota bacterium]HPI88867.1 class I SAM-dependent methyltransferase [Spirochaetota bacterium]HPR47003.1 class I SAM-dependent methyltransferase [Spirochaetota bacterium]
MRVRSVAGPLFYCPGCGIAFNTGHHALAYNDAYFLEEYRSQYGKTYLDDFPNIYAVAVKRLNIILRLLKNRSGTGGMSLLDVGSAMGFFLKAASDRGIKDLVGIEISSYAAGHCSRELGIPVVNRAFSPESIERDYDIITAWFFIEHGSNPVDTIRALAARVKAGGVLAFSVPSVFGPLFMFNRDAWVRSHPEDHSMDFSPRSLRRILKKEGFKKIVIVPAGFHPERIVSSGSLFYPVFRPFYRFISRILAFSDTVEVYARR